MKFSGDRALPPSVVTVTGTVPVPAGSVTVRVVQSALTAVTVAFLEPNRTVGTPPLGVLHRLAPLMVTGSPPPSGPLVGLMPVTTGAAR